MHPSFFCNYNNESHSKNYNPHYMEYNHQPSLIVADHENSNFKNNIINVPKSSYNYNNINNNNYVVVENNKCIPTSKRSSKKDRHSKINTARGPRDRRMRLSLDVAKNFFRLQDMLGFDKASNTIEWLIMKSKPAIRDLLSQQHSNLQSCSLIRSLNSSASSGSECEVLSDIDHDNQSLDKIGEDQVIDNENLMITSTARKSNKEKKNKVARGARKSVYTVAKETREKARERARKRTSEKRYFKFGCSDDQYTRVLIRPGVIDQNTNRLGSWIPFAENQVHTTTTTTDHQQPQYPSNSHSTQLKQARNIAGENSSVMMSNNWMPSSLFNYHDNPAGSSSHQHHQFSDFQIHQGKPWAGIHN